MSVFFLPTVRNYLRVRGEYRAWIGGNPTVRELPPRARRIPHARVCRIPADGTTSACAENTPRHQPADGKRRNYLRVRGEYEGKFTVTVARLELPPRARRIPLRVVATPESRGTTSACAENTCHRHQMLGYPWNYLRVRGEYPK